VEAGGLQRGKPLARERAPPFRKGQDRFAFAPTVGVGPALPCIEIEAAFDRKDGGGNGAAAKQGEEYRQRVLDHWPHRCDPRGETALRVPACAAKGKRYGGSW